MIGNKHLDDQIIGYFAERYTDSIIVDPPFAGNTLLVWLLPVLATVARVVLIFSRRKTRAATTAEARL